MASIRWIILGLVFGLASGVGGLAPAPVAAQSPCDIAYACSDAVAATAPCDPAVASESCSISLPDLPVVVPPPPVEDDFCTWHAAACGEALPAEP